MANFILAMDQGTTSSRAIIFDRAGTIVAADQKEFQQYYPKPGWVEHDAQEIWASQIVVAKNAMQKAVASAGDIAGIGITNQRETTLVWDRQTGEPIYRAIVWQDRRTAGYCDELKERGLEAKFKEKTGLVLDPYFSATKLRWILQNVEGALGRAQRGELAFGTIDSWLLWKLTDGKAHLTDASNASRTLLYHHERGAWDEELLEIMGIPRALMPDVRSSSEVYARTDADIFGQPIPISGMAGDQQAATFGQACFGVGQGKNTYGTGCFMLMNTGGQVAESTNDLLSTVAWKLKGKTTYSLEGSVFVAGAVVQWLRSGLGIIERTEDVEALARSVVDNGGVYLVPAFTGLGAPHWDPYARGTIIGITRGTTAGHIARASLESIAYQVHDVIRAMEADSGTPLEELRVDGGASRNDLLLQFQADLLGIPVVRPTITETTALGAAYLAGLAVDFWRDQQELGDLWQEEKRFEPKMPEASREALLAKWSKAVERAKDWVTE